MWSLAVPETIPRIGRCPSDRVCLAGIAYGRKEGYASFCRGLHSRIRTGLRLSGTQTTMAGKITKWFRAVKFWIPLGPDWGLLELNYSPRNQLWTPGKPHRPIWALTWKLFGFRGGSILDPGSLSGPGFFGHRGHLFQDISALRSCYNAGKGSRKPE